MALSVWLHFCLLNISSTSDNGVRSPDDASPLPLTHFWQSILILDSSAYLSPCSTANCTPKTKVPEQSDERKQARRALAQKIPKKYNLHSFQHKFSISTPFLLEDTPRPVPARLALEGVVSQDAGMNCCASLNNLNNKSAQVLRKSR